MIEYEQAQIPTFLGAKKIILVDKTPVSLGMSKKQTCLADGFFTEMEDFLILDVMAVSVFCKTNGKL